MHAIPRPFHSGRRFGSRLAVAVLLLGGTIGCSDSPLERTDGIPASIVLQSSSSSIQSLGEEITLHATVLDAAGDEIHGIPLAWTSQDPGVLVHVEGSTFRSVSSGDATVEVRIDAEYPSVNRSGYTAGSLEASDQVRVRQVAVGIRVADEDGVEIPRLRLWSLGQRLTIPVQAVDARGHAVPDASLDLRFSIEDKLVSEVSPHGELRAMRDGETLVRILNGGHETFAVVAVEPNVALEFCVDFAEGAALLAAQSRSCAPLHLTFEERTGS